MSSQGLESQTIASLAALLVKRSVSPVELTELMLLRIERMNPALNAYITVVPERALEAAKRAEAAIAAGDYRGPLHGIPIAHKDVLLTAGVRTTAHSVTLQDHVPTQDATVVARLDAAGAVMLGKLNTYEFACGATEGFGVPVNPWNVGRTTGGSSAGPAAAPAASLCFGATGTDAGGSNRGPAAYCGLVGIKATYGRVSRSGVLSASYSLDHVGPLARTVLDAAIMLQAMSGFDPRDPASSRRPVPNYVAATGGLDGGGRADLRGLRVGVPRAWVEEQVAHDVAMAVGAAVTELEQLGAVVVPVELASAKLSMAAAFGILFPEATSAHAERLRSELHRLAPFTRHTLMMGACTSGLDYILAQQARHAMLAELERCFRNVDAIAWPTTARTAPPVDRPERWTTVQTQLTNLTGHPSLTVPCGFDSDGLPIGLHLTGRMFDEETVLGLAAAYERATEWHTRRPEVPLDHRPPRSKPYALGTLEGVPDAEHSSLIEDVRRGLGRYGIPVLDEDLEPLAGRLYRLRAGLAALKDGDHRSLEPLVHQHVAHVPTG
jgi:aspartyl-tRNA(Asn)/glutamyl-tRNA(Gln) amidotransferase subunit A